jgi:hypothetical protein
MYLKPKMLPFFTLVGGLNEVQPLRDIKVKNASKIDIVVFLIFIFVFLYERVKHK